MRRLILWLLGHSPNCVDPTNYRMVWQAEHEARREAEQLYADKCREFERWVGLYADKCKEKDRVQDQLNQVLEK